MPFITQLLCICAHITKIAADTGWAMTKMNRQPLWAYSLVYSPSKILGIICCYK